METNQTLAQAPFFTIIVPLRELALPLLSITLDSVVSQHSATFEVLVVDAYPQEDRCHVLSSYGEVVRRVASEGENLSMLINDGLKVARGHYVHILLPGEFYLSRRASYFMQEFLIEEACPDLAYCGFILRHCFSTPQTILRRICRSDLKGGKLSTSLQPYWFRRETLVAMGGFNDRYKLQAGFDLICRFFESTSLKKAFLRRILTDQEYRKPSSKRVIGHFRETLVIICIHFGLNKALLWWMAQNHVRLLLWSLKSIKKACWKGELVKKW